VALGAVGARVTAVDGFGNVQLNATSDDLEAAGLGDERVLVVNGRRLPRAGTFAELPEHEPGMIVDSAGYLSIVVNHGNAAAAMRLAARDTVILEGR
jgi:S-adenosyl-L-methionine hydrolase (adenosine-forming)